MVDNTKLDEILKQLDEAEKEYNEKLAKIDFDELLDRKKDEK